MIANDLSLLIERLLATASSKERLFFGFMTGKEISGVSEGTTPTDRLCYESFALHAKKSEVLESLQRSKPYKNIHYSANLIDLVAAARIDPEGERDHVQEYLATHQLREAYLLHLALNTPIDEGRFGTIEETSAVEGLIYSLVIQRSIGETDRLFIDALAEANDIFDALVLRHLYQTYLRLHPDSPKLDHYESLISSSVALFNAFNRFIRIVLSIGIAACFFVFVRWYYMNQMLYKELEKVLPLGAVALLVLLAILGINIPEKTKVIRWCTDKAVAAVYRLFGLRYDELQRALSALPPPDCTVEK